KGEFYTVKRSSFVKYFKPDAAFICCHGGEGENGIVQAILEYNGIPNTSPSVLASACGMDKALCKQIFDGMLLNTLPYEVLSREEFESDGKKTVARLESMLEYPLIVKPACQGSSIGISVAENGEQLEFALQVASKFDSKIIVEHKLTDFVEVNCAAFRNGDKIVLSETEQPLTFNDFLTFDDKYMSNGKMGGGGHIIPADIGSLELVVKANTERIYRELDLNGVVRVDYLVDKAHNKVYVNEINTIPGSMAFYLFEPQGVDFKTLISRLIENAVNYQSLHRTPSAYKTDVLSMFKSGAKMAK
ncbi:MAG: D-alanine--D-alanine ligase, partial [Clostridia bacterium]|nr:D-alanine--D-alanine ligase [Clostridia bacterium]